MQKAPYGSWQSPISAELVAQAIHQLSEVKTDEGCVYWLEQYPEQKGRAAIQCRDLRGEIREITPKNFSVRTRVHEYGGGNYTVQHGVVFFSNDRDQRIYRQEKNKIPLPLTPMPDEQMSARYADGCVTPDGKFLICVRETHYADEVVNDLIAVATDGSQNITVLAEGHDFYAAPRVNENGTKLLYLCWDQPHMPWDGTLLCLADFDVELNVRNTHVIAGGDNESISQPKFNSDGDIYFISDRNNWTNIYRYHAGTINPVLTLEAEFGYPAWVFGTNMYELLDKANVVAIYQENGVYSLGLIREHTLKKIEVDFDYFAPSLAVFGDFVYAIASNGACAPVLVQIDLESGQAEIIHSSSSLLINADYLSLREKIEFPTENNQTAHAYYYAPHNPRYTGLEGELPPLIVHCHGGPTSAATTSLNLKIQYWTSRGFAVVDVNYGGSVGYGRAYRERLTENWGVVDVEDSVNAAKYLVAQGLVDPDRLIIKGSSAGGYTVLCAMIQHDLFAAGASHYGVADLISLVEHTHKFESRYLDKLVGPYPEKKQTYYERSPVNHPDRLSCPIIFFQGLEDKVVLPAQTETMIAALEKKSLPYAYVTYPYEQHGFRDAASIKNSLESEYSFYAQIFGITPADSLKMIKVHNFKMR